MTLLLSRSRIVGLIDVAEAIEALRAGFVAPPAVERPVRARTDLPGAGTATALLPGLLPGVPAYTVKVNAKFPAASPALRGVVCLHSLADGRLLALLDSATVTAWRTGLSAALATDALAAPDADTLALVGAGAQARLVLRGLQALRRLSELTVCDVDPGRARQLAEEVRAGTELRVRVVPDPVEAVRQARMVVLSTWSRRPLLDVRDVPAGSQVTSLGADEPGKVELSAGLLQSARVVVDDVRLAVSTGALGNVGLGPQDAAAVLGDVLAGRSAGRQDDEQVTVYAPVGLPWQDLALAHPVYRAARSAPPGTYPTIDLLA